MYIHELADWPRFRFRFEALADLLGDVRYRQGMLVGRMDTLGLGSRKEATLEAVVQEVRKSSEIEGEYLDEAQVRSSVAKRLGLDIAGLPPDSRDVDGVVDMVLDARENYDRPLTEERIFGWHAGIFPIGRSGLERIAVGSWRQDSMQVFSGPIGKRRVHFEAPPVARIPQEMERFLTWFNDPREEPTILRAAIAHLWFVTIHPLNDGNGRVGRTIMDMSLAQAERRKWRAYSMSAQICNERQTYYNELERAQKGDLDVTHFLIWFLMCISRAMAAADETLTRSLERARFWQHHAATPFNARQRKVISMLFNGIDTNLTNAKYAKLANTSPDTALRDLAQLVALGVLRREGELKGTRYYLSALESM